MCWRTISVRFSRFGSLSLRAVIPSSNEIKDGPVSWPLGIATGILITFCSNILRYIKAPANSDTFRLTRIRNIYSNILKAHSEPIQDDICSKKIIKAHSDAIKPMYNPIQEYFICSNILNSHPDTLEPNPPAAPAVQSLQPPGR
eukprot:g8664.t1